MIVRKPMTYDRLSREKGMTVAKFLKESEWRIGREEMKAGLRGLPSPG
jgi:hypothetical protein